MSQQPQQIKPSYRPKSSFSLSSPFGRFMDIIIVLLLLIVGLMMLGLGLFGFIAQLVEGRGVSIMLLILAAFSVLLLYALWQASLSATAKYRFDDAGLEVDYPLHKPFIIPWQQFQTVGIYFSNNDPRYLDKAFPILLCVMKGEKHNLYGHWKIANPFHIKRVITMQYTPALYAGLQEKCTVPVADLRIRYWITPREE